MIGADGKVLLSEEYCHNKESVKFPERVIQIGEGNFLRGFADWIVHQLNKNGLFGGRIVVVAPRKSGAKNIAQLNSQDGLFTVWLRGVYQGRQVDEREIVSSVSRGIDPYKNWNEFLRCAENPDIDIVVSNTTESGIQYTYESFQEGMPVQSFPSKLTAYLYHRFCHFDGDSSSGMTIVPCELVDDNGSKLRDVVLHHAKDWELSSLFISWIMQHNHFCNTLVDRIVTGFPKGEDADQLLSKLEYRDDLVTVGEPFHMWVIEADERLPNVWPFSHIGLNVEYVSDITPYRMQKVRILNGAHTAMCALGLLAGFRTVGECVSHPVFGQFIRKLINEEIVPTLVTKMNLERAMVEQFSDSVIERFVNPFVHHELSALTLNGLSKIRVRLLPTLNDFHEQQGKVPPLLSAAIAGQLLFYRNADNEKERWVIQDDANLVQWIEGIWGRAQDADLSKTIVALIGNLGIWGQDLNEIPDLADVIVSNLQRFRTEGIESALASIIDPIQET